MNLGSIHPITVVSEQAGGAIKENVETNIERNITKNYIINEERNYYVQQDPIIETSNPVHNQEVQLLPGPTVTTVNMAAERITDNTGNTLHSPGSREANASLTLVCFRLGEDRSDGWRQ